MKQLLIIGLLSVSFVQCSQQAKSAEYLHMMDQYRYIDQTWHKAQCARNPDGSMLSQEQLDRLNVQRDKAMALCTQVNKPLIELAKK